MPRLPRTLVVAGLAGVLQAANTSDSQRWTSTATDGTGLALGTPVTLTWSIVPDGLPLGTFAAAPGNDSPVSDLIGRLDQLWAVPIGERTADLTTRPWFEAMRSRFDLYESKTGLTYVYVTDDGAPTGSGGRASSPTRGDIRIAGTALSGLLGYNSGPGTGGDMVLNTAGSTFADPNSLRIVFAHEHAHGLGLNHGTVDGSGINSVVSPQGGNVAGPQFDDLLALQRKYGDPLEKGPGNDSIARATPLGRLTASAPLAIGLDTGGIRVAAGDTDLISIDDDSDIDVFSFETDDPVSARFTLRPLGPTYTYQPEGGPEFTIAASSRSNLRIELLDSTGTTMAASDSAPAGTDEVIDFPLASPGTHHVVVRGAADALQFYSLEIAVIDTDSDGDGVPDAIELAQGRDPATPDFYFLFNRDGDAEGWSADTQFGPLSVGGGELFGVTSGNDPKLTSPLLRLVADDHPMLAVRLRSDTGGPCQLYWARVGSPGVAVTPVPTAELPGDNLPHVIFFDLSAHPDWSGATITRLRFDPVNRSGAGIAIDAIWTTDGDVDDDGIPDDLEPAGDADGDGLENWQDPDADNDGIADGAELAKGRDPFDGSVFFEFEGDAEGWAGSAQVQGLEVTDGTLRFTSAGGDPQIFRTGPRFHGDSVRTVLVRLQAEHASRLDLFWGIPGADNFAAERRLTTEYSGSGSFQWVVLPTDHPLWQGRDILRLRVDPTALSGETIAIDSIYLSDGDLDHDGMADGDEAVAGTNPVDPTDFPRATALASGGLLIRGHAERRYQLQRSASLRDDWQDIGTAVDSPGDFDLTLTDPDPPVGRAFYRCVISRSVP